MKTFDLYKTPKIVGRCEAPSELLCGGARRGLDDQNPFVDVVVAVAVVVVVVESS